MNPPFNPKRNTGKRDTPVAASTAPSRRDYFLVLLAGALYALSFPRYGTFVAAWMFMLPLLLALKGKSPRGAARLGFIAGFLGNLGIVYWVVYSVHFYGKVPLPFSVATMLLLVTYLSLYFLIFSLLAAQMLQRPSSLPLGLAALWVVLEYAKAHILTGFPWENLGYSQLPVLPLVQIADFAGVYAISFLIVFASGAAFVTLASETRPALKVSHAAVALILLLTTVIYGNHRMDSIEHLSKNLPGEDIAVALIQGNIPQDVKWEPSQQEYTVQQYRNLIQQSNFTQGIIVFPEAAMPFLLQERKDYRDLVAAMMTDTSSWGVVGGLAISDRHPFSISNSAFVFSPAGAITERYDKVHLVPFGEYVPRWVPFVKKLTADIGEIKAGRRLVPVKIGNFTAGILVCYEAIFPEISRAYARSNASVLIGITNDGWFGRTSAPFQHLDMAVLRAVETRRFLVRTANTGISAIVAPTGRIIAQTDIFVATSLKGTIRPLTFNTIYTRYGDWLVLCCFLFLVLQFAWRVQRHGRGLRAILKGERKNDG